ncbi:MAG: CRISPR-associated protein Cas4 [Thermoplasmatales archaeon]|nr:CRISPR-associated protein Cas4 [Thermoplasmatales archaeon]
MTASTSMVFTGTQINYYFICKKKLWLFSHDLQMEHSSDKVLLGKLLHETSYPRKFREIELEGIKIDFLEKGCEIHEVKKSRRIEKAHIYQLLYYLYYLKKLGVSGKGVINYPLLRKKMSLELTEEKEKETEEILKDIKHILSLEKPLDVEKKTYCKKCSYYELCWC